MTAKRNISSPSSRSCTGCGACDAICPVSAIKMQLNDDGFYVPMVDIGRCIDCGRCQKACYRFLPPDTAAASMAEQPVWGVYSNDPVTHRTTTSGGVAYELSRWGLKAGYKILGVVYNYDHHDARTVLIEHFDELERLKGSKYIQAKTEYGLKLLKQKVTEDVYSKYICFGTPCQMFGLRQLIKEQRWKNEFILVDLFCHGVPSYLVWTPYVLQKQQELGQLHKINFRYKGNGWHQYTIRLEGERRTYTQYAYKDVFYRYFFDNVALNASCYDCWLRKRSTAADLRIGDFWGEVYEHRDDGVSAAVAATETGRKLLEILQCEGVLTVDNTWDIETCLKSQSMHDYPLRPLRDAVLGRLRSGYGLASTQRWYFRRIPLQSRIRSVLKRVVSTCLPNRFLVHLRQMVR